MACFTSPGLQKTIFKACQFRVPSPIEDQNSLKLKLNMKNMQIGIWNVKVLVLHLHSLLNVLKTTPKALSLFIVSIYENQISSNEHLMKHCSKIMINFMMYVKKDTPLYLFLIQSCEHIKASKISGVRRLRWSLRTLPLVLNADSEAIVLTGVANISRASSLKVG